MRATLPLPPEIVTALSRGWQVIPLHAAPGGVCSCGKKNCKVVGKHPRTPHGLKDASNDLRQVDAWHSQYPGCNWAMVTGQVSGVWVLDVDGEPGLAALAALDRQGKRLPDTLTVSTARGSHLYFTWPDRQTIRNSAGKIAQGLDIRGDDGYVVIPPSMHRSGVLYSYIEDEHEPAAAPPWLLEMIRGNTLPVVEQASPIDSIGPGRRTPILVSTAGKLRSLGVSQNGILGALRGLNATFAPPREEAKLLQIVKGMERYPAGHAPGVLAPDLICLADVVARPVPWLWKGYLALGMLAMLSGDPDAGKTFIALAIAAELSNGRVPVSGEQCDPLTTLYLSHENAPEYVIRPRYDALRGNPSRFHLLRGSVIGDGDGAVRGSVTLKDIPILDAAIDRTGARLIIVDPIQSYLGAEVDAHRSNETRPVMDGLIALAEKYSACVLVVRHLAKAGSSRAIHRGLGSIDLTGAVRMEMIAGSAADDPSSRALVQIKNNVGVRAESLGYKIEGDGMEAKLEWSGPSALTAADLLAPDGEAEERTDIAAAVDFVRGQLSSGPKLVKDLAKEFPVRTIQRAGKRVGITRSRDGENGSWIWSLRNVGDKNSVGVNTVC